MASPFSQSVGPPRGGRSARSSVVARNRRTTAASNLSRWHVCSRWSSPQPAQPQSWSVRRSPQSVLPNPSLKRDLRRHGTWPARRSLSSFASRAKRHTGYGPLAQTLGLEGDTVTASGLLRGFVVNSVDPLRRRRLLVSVSTLPELGTTWALTCVPQGSRAIPKVGTTVWLMFEQEQPTSLVWLGVLPKAA